jgi:uncharacterized protein
MKWFGRGESSNVEDRRGFGGKGMAIGGAGGLILLVLSMFFGVDLTQMTGGSSPQTPTQSRRATDPAEDSLASFTKVVFRDTEVVWNEVFKTLGKTYTEPTLVLYSDHVSTACGSAQSAVGPFYCPGDSRVFIDLSFYQDMERKLDAKGDFARAYVIAHEVGHHVQRLLGYSRRSSRDSVPLELQADYLAGVWAHHAQKKFGFLEEGDLEEAINAAHQVGDDTLQKRARGHVMPDSFTHGSSAQRTYWFKQGFRSGDMRLAAGPFENPAARIAE